MRGMTINFQMNHVVIIYSDLILILILIRILILILKHVHYFLILTLRF